MSDASLKSLAFVPICFFMDPSAFSFRVFVPEDVRVPVEFYDDVNAFRVGVVERAHVGKLPEGWDVPAVYVLLGERDSDGGWDAYVGKAPAGVKARLRQHVRSKEGWSRALVVVRDTTMGMNSAQIGWLEGRLHELLRDEYSGVRMLNAVQPGDKTLLAHDHVEGAVVTVRNVLRVLGYETSRPTKTTAKQSGGINKKKPVVHHASMGDIVTAGILPAGTTLVSTAPKYPSNATVEANGDITVNGQSFTSPSAAGRHIRGGKATNGWTFWAVKQPDGPLKPLAEYRKDCMSKFG